MYSTSLARAPRAMISLSAASIVAVVPLVPRTCAARLTTDGQIDVFALRRGRRDGVRAVHSRTANPEREVQELTRHKCEREAAIAGRCQKSKCFHARRFGDDAPDAKLTSPIRNHGWR